jgi:hypothetical protein
MTILGRSRRLLPALVLVLGGCYSYVGIGSRVPDAGGELQLELVPARDVTLQDVTVHGITGIQGRALTSDAESLGVAVHRLWGLEGRSYDATGIGVRVPRSDITTLRIKRLSPAKSTVAVVAGSAAVVAAVLSIRQIVGSGGSGRPKPMP